MINGAIRWRDIAYLCAAIFGRVFKWNLTSACVNVYVYVFVCVCFEHKCGCVLSHLVGITSAINCRSRDNTIIDIENDTMIVIPINQTIAAGVPVCLDTTETGSVSIDHRWTGYAMKENAINQSWKLFGWYQSVSPWSDRRKSQRPTSQCVWELDSNRRNQMILIIMTNHQLIIINHNQPSFTHEYIN